MEPALEVERRATPGPAHEGDALLDARSAVGAVGLERLVVLQGAAAPDADLEAAAAHHVEHRQLFREIDWMVQRQEAHAHPEPQGRRARRDERREHLRGRAEPVVVEVVLGDPHRRVAERFGGEHLGEAGVVDVPLAPRLVALHEKEQTELHTSSRGGYGDSIRLGRLTGVYDTRSLPTFVSVLKSPIAAIRRCSASATLPTPSV